jgi:Xaa-Pro aminopeptidase
VVDEVLQDEQGQPLRVGKIKDMIHLMLAERGAEAPTGPIFAPGREGAIGHSVGRTDQVIKLGIPIVFDLYPRHRDGGYYFDFTRTWCLGYAPPEVSELYDDVLQVYRQNFASMQAGAIPLDIQVASCRLFEQQGHPTIMSDPDTQSGYFHALAHGLGLALHEAPIFRHYDNPANIPLEPGMVITYEPGLYYPEQNMGVRLEDPFLIQPEGPPQLLLEYPLDLVLPMRNG